MLIDEALLEEEGHRLNEAVEVSRAQLEALKSQMMNAGEEHSLILDTHLLMLKDPTLIDETHRSWWRRELMPNGPQRTQRKSWCF